MLIILSSFLLKKSSSLSAYLDPLKSSPSPFQIQRRRFQRRLGRVQEKETREKGGRPSQRTNNRNEEEIEIPGPALEHEIFEQNAMASFDRAVALRRAS